MVVIVISKVTIDIMLIYNVINHEKLTISRVKVGCVGTDHNLVLKFVCSLLLMI